MANRYVVTSDASEFVRDTTGIQIANCASASSLGNLSEAMRGATIPLGQLRIAAARRRLDKGRVIGNFDGPSDA